MRFWLNQPDGLVPLTCGGSLVGVDKTNATIFFRKTRLGSRSSSAS
jgi:hypothetical protein